MKYLFLVHVAPGHNPDNYANAWVEASKIIQQAAGARGTYLHRDLENPQRLLAIAHWQDKAARDSASSRVDDRVKAIVQAQAEYCRIELIGEFAEPDWQVLPTAPNTQG
ncbi:MAG: antibiotic biosynthesis monooxygenase [Gammaproteobacteria bacterium]